MPRFKSKIHWAHVGKWKREIDTEERTSLRNVHASAVHSFVALVIIWERARKFSSTSENRGSTFYVRNCLQCLPCIWHRRLDSIQHLATKQPLLQCFFGTSIKLHQFQAFLHDGKNARSPRLTVVGLPVLKNESPILESRQKPGKKRVQDGKASAGNRYLRFAHPYEEQTLLRRHIREVMSLGSGTFARSFNCETVWLSRKDVRRAHSKWDNGKKWQYGLPTPTTDSEMMFSPKVQLVHESKEARHWWPCIDEQNVDDSSLKTFDS
jgi:hypothetical protein